MSNSVTKKLIAFDLDDTLAVTKNSISPRMAELLAELADFYEICVITGGLYKQMEEHIIDQLTVTPSRFGHFHFMPVNGSQYHHYGTSDDKWRHEQLTEDLTELEKIRISQTLEKVARQLGYWEEHPAGPIIADRRTQITFSALGQQAEAKDKYAWDPQYVKRRNMYDLAAKELPDFEVRINGNTSIDVTHRGIDKGFGIEWLRKQLDLKRSEILFVGDQLQEGGNDYPVKALGIDTINVQNVQQTEFVIEGLIADGRKRRPTTGALGDSIIMKIPQALEPIVAHLVALHVDSREDMKRQLTDFFRPHDVEVLDTHNTTSVLFQFTAGKERYGLKIEYGLAEVLRGEARWYELAPAELKPHHVLSHIAERYTFVLLRWLPNATTLEEVAIANEGKPTEETMDLVIMALEQDKKLFESNPTVPLETSRGSSFFFDKYHAYNAGARNFPYLQALLDSESVRVNDKILAGPYRYVLAVQQNDELRSYLSPDRAGLIHGDAHAGNLLVADKRVYMIDPKGADHFPLEYDTGRMFWSLNGWNAIVRGEFELTIEGDGRYVLSVVRRQQYVDGLGRFRAYLGERGYYRAVYSAAMQYLTRVHHATKEAETTALYLRGLQVFDELFAGLGVKA